MIQLPNGQYQIKDTFTGQNLNVNAADLPKYGLQAPQQQGNVDLGSILGGVGNFLSGLVQNNLGAFKNAIQGQQQQAASQPSAKGNPIQAIINAGQSTANLAKNTVLNPKLWAEDASLVPDLYGGSGILARVGLGGIAGLAGGAAQPNATPGSVATSGATDAILNAIIPGGNKLDLENGTINLGKEGTQDLFQAAKTNAPEVADALEKEVNSKVNGINQLLEAYRPKAQEAEGQLQDVLNNVKSPVPATDIVNNLRSIAETNGYNFTIGENGTGNAAVDPVLSKVRSLLYPDNGQMTLSEVNDAKRILSQNYNKAPVYQDMYHYLQTYIEQSSGVPDTVKALNQQAHNYSTTLNSLQAARDAVNKQTVGQALDDLKIGNAHKLNMLTQRLSLAGKLVGFFAVPGHPFLGTMLGGGIAKQLGETMESPVAKQQLESTITKHGANAANVYNLLRYFGIKGLSNTAGSTMQN
jgi:hypothetical protein